jgi:hypothetical protein
MALTISDGGGGVTTAGLFGGLPGILGQLSELVMDAVTVGQVKAHLMQAKAKLEEAQALMPAIPASGVGGSPWGSQLSEHSKLAHERLLETINEMTVGLDRYEVAMQTAYKDVIGTEEQVTTDLKQGACYVGGPTTTVPASCEP